MKKLLYFSSLVYVFVFLPTQVVFAQAHQRGTNIFSGQQVYTIQLGACSPKPLPLTNPTHCSQDVLRAYPSAAAFLSYGKNSWTSLAPANNDDLALEKGSLMPFAPGTLVNDQGTIYIMRDDGGFGLHDNLNNNVKNGIPDAATFLSLGYKWSNVITADTSYIPLADIVSSSSGHLPGTLVNDKGTIYYITNDGKIGFVSMDEFTAKGFNLKNVVPANNQDSSLQADYYGWAGPIPQ